MPSRDAIHDGHCFAGDGVDLYQLDIADFTEALAIGGDIVIAGANVANLQEQALDDDRSLAGQGANVGEDFVQAAIRPVDAAEQVTVSLAAAMGCRRRSSCAGNFRAVLPKAEAKQDSAIDWLTTRTKLSCNYRRYTANQYESQFSDKALSLDISKPLLTLRRTHTVPFDYL